ncbi:MAG: chemotaxis protein CheD [Candidatus Omnitrophota bacterium]|jgi:chemotaxis protein CheD|nr:MAG: chemotaxis protein CheD [Candidatus Omnitrophota bacterium]
MNNTIITVGISDMKVSNDKSAIIVTYSLGSCVGLTLYDPAVGVGGMIHCLLPLSKANPNRAQQNPQMFVDSGIPVLLAELSKFGAQKNRLIAKVAGAGNFLQANDMFKTGERNYTVLRKVLWKNNILIKGEDVGGSIPRTMTLYMKTGTTTIKSRGVETEL